MCALDVLDIRGLVKNFSAFDCCSKHAPRTANREKKGGGGSYTRNRDREMEGGRLEEDEEIGCWMADATSTFVENYTVENKADRT